MSDDIESSQPVGATNLMRDIVMLYGVDDESRAYLCPHGKSDLYVLTVYKSPRQRHTDPIYPIELTGEI